MKRIIVALVAAFTLTFTGVGMGVASAAPVATVAGSTTTVVAQITDPNGVIISTYADGLARLYPSGEVGAGITISQFGGSSLPSGATFRGFTIYYPGYSITFRWEGGIITVTYTR